MTVNYLLILIVLLLFAGLGVDAGMLEWRYLQLSVAARAAATSGVIALQRYGSGGISPSALNAASLNGFTNGSNGVTVTVQNPPTSGQYVSASSAVRVSISQSVATSFMSLVAFPTVTIKSYYDLAGSTPVSMTSAFNVYAIFRDSTTVSNGGFDNHNYAFSANAIDPVRTSNNLGAELAWRGNIFTLGAPDGKNGAANVTVTLTSGKFSQLLLLASAAYGGNSQSFVVNYSDGSTATTSFPMSDWCSPSGASSNSTNEVWVQQMPYRLYSSSGTQTYANYIYGYAIGLTNTKTVSSVTLPSSRNVVVFAINLAP
jgi:hypothetical protein